ncbi:helix-turn-helix domain-containing protein [Pandoraea commovens]|uniref:Helix-turn-helix domain-containing protein n=1 Tax=Pandoraea commovens TaxID=2508289 RepID=A0ABY5QKN3_9BURK|nr:helix-turn-helix domain-containing protein [Pandoraea commovens]UVA80455.1 helix-turn-helix domain-containing protein [Pandoraea commovens]
MTALPNFFNWRKAMQKSDLHPHSRLILHTIGCYMNVADEIAWPSIERLVEETGLSRSSVCKYLDAAVKAGWLEKWRRRQPGEQWAQNHYRLAVPDGVVRVHVAEVAGLLQSPSHGRDDTQMLDSKAAANGLGPYHGRNAEQGPQDGLDDSGEGMPERDFGGDQVRGTDTNTPLSDVSNKTSLVPSGDGTRNDLSFDGGMVVDDAAEDLRLAEWIFARILGMHPKHRQPDMESWARDVRLMRERDNHSRREIAALFDWANRDAFWRRNILSPGKLRDQWDQLVIRREASTVVAAGKVAALPAATHADGGCCHVSATGERCSRPGAMKHGGHWWCMPHYRDTIDNEERA